MHVAKTKALISFAVTAKLICAFVFAYAKSRFSHNEAHIILFCAKEELSCSVISYSAISVVNFLRISFNSPVRLKQTIDFPIKNCHLLETILMLFSV